MNAIVVSALYKFVPLPHFKSLKAPLLAFMQAQQIKGTLLLAKEGINGTVSGNSEAITALYTFLDKQPGLENINHKESFHDKAPFNRTKVKLKKEIVTLGVENIDPLKSAGTYIKPKDWNTLLQDKEVTLIDTRNDYEVQLGTFKGALNPETTTFREFPDYVKNNLDPATHKKIAMFCTGGIRCEKSTAYLKELGFKEVYHLEGGILKYLEIVPEEDSLWQGECFVFDERVSVNHALKRGQYDQCHACRFPISENDKQTASYQPGISCPHCIDTKNDDQKQRYQEREKQNRLAKNRGETHIGDAVNAIIVKRRIEKKQNTQ